MDHALGVKLSRDMTKVISLNPCFNGPCSRRQFVFNCLYLLIVLILVLMDHALGDV